MARPRELDGARARTINFDAETDEIVDAIAEEHGRSRSEVVRDMARTYRKEDRDQVVSGLRAKVDQLQAELAKVKKHGALAGEHGDELVRIADRLDHDVTKTLSEEVDVLRRVTVEHPDRYRTVVRFMADHDGPEGVARAELRKRRRNDIPGDLDRAARAAGGWSQLLDLMEAEEE